MIPIRVTHIFGIGHPILNGGMTGGLGTAELMAVVANPHRLPNDRTSAILSRLVVGSGLCPGPSLRQASFVPISVRQCGCRRPS